MADDDWESREDFDDLGTTKPIVAADKWAGEDEEDVKDNWDDEESGEKVPGTGDLQGPTKAVVKPKKKKLNKLLAEIDGKTVDKMAQLNLTPEELAAQKLRDEKLREQAEIQSVKDAFGPSAINYMDPQTKDDFDALRKQMLQEIIPFEKRANFDDFVEDMIQDLAVFLPSKRLKKVKTTIEALYFEKTKVEKAATPKGPGGGKGSGKTKAKLHIDTERSILKPVEDDFDEYEDFM